MVRSVRTAVKRLPPGPVLCLWVSAALVSPPGARGRSSASARLPWSRATPPHESRHRRGGGAVAHAAPVAPCVRFFRPRAFVFLFQRPNSEQQQARLGRHTLLTNQDPRLRARQEQTRRECGVRDGGGVSQSAPRLPAARGPTRVRSSEVSSRTPPSEEPAQQLRVVDARVPLHLLEAHEPSKAALQLGAHLAHPVDEAELEADLARVDRTVE
jgi:hypothetical protein